MKRVLLLATAVLVGCDTTPLVARYEPFCEASQARADWVAECAEAANPKSDEEGEDLVAQCERTSERLLCPHRWVSAQVNTGVLFDVIPCDVAVQPERLDKCRAAGWKRAPK